MRAQSEKDEAAVKNLGVLSATTYRSWWAEQGSNL